MGPTLKSVFFILIFSSVILHRNGVVEGYFGGLKLLWHELQYHHYPSNSLVLFQNTQVSHGVGVLVSNCAFLAKKTSTGGPYVGTASYLPNVLSKCRYSTGNISSLIATRDHGYIYPKLASRLPPSSASPATLPFKKNEPPPSRTQCQMMGFGNDYTQHRLPATVISNNDCATEWARVNSAVSSAIQKNPKRYFCAYPTSESKFSRANFTFFFETQDLPGPLFCKNWQGPHPVKQPNSAIGNCGATFRFPSSYLFSGFAKYYVEGVGVPPVVFEFSGAIIK